MQDYGNPKKRMKKQILGMASFCSSRMNEQESADLY